MKKLILIAACMGLFTTATFAQSSKHAHTAKKEKKVVYVCPKCHATSDKPGECMKCHVAMLKEGTYYCPGCGATSDKPMECKKCHREMVKVTAK